jgi:uncharacterized protein with HEPN domain
MAPESAKLLEDMRQAARAVIAMVQGETFVQYQADQRLRWAVERGFEIIGEALTQLNKVDPTMAQSITDWRAIIGFRNVLIHGYAVVQHDKTWDIAQRELPILLAEVEKLLAGP